MADNIPRGAEPTESTSMDIGGGMDEAALMRDFDAIMARVDAGIAAQQAKMASLLDRLKRNIP